MRTPTLVLTLALTVVASATHAQTKFAEARADGPSIAASQVVQSPPTTTEKLEREVFSLVNAQRVQHGLSELPWSDDLAKVAHIHSDNMADQKFFSHKGTDGSMVDDRADRVGLGEWRVIGENIAYVRGFENPAAIALEKWLESTAHRNNLLGANWQESAVAISVASDGTYYMTQVFLLRK